MFKGWPLTQRTKQQEWKEGKKGRKAPRFPARPVESVAALLTETVEQIMGYSNTFFYSEVCSYFV